MIFQQQVVNMGSLYAIYTQVTGWIWQFHLQCAVTGRSMRVTGWPDTLGRSALSAHIKSLQKPCNASFVHCQYHAWLL